MYESINTMVCVKQNNISDPSIIQLLFYSLTLSLDCSNHLGEHNQIKESTNKW